MKNLSNLPCAALAILFISVTASAQVDTYRQADIQAIGRALTPSGPISADKSLAHHGNHYFLVAKRAETGSSELHEREADVFVIESGEAMLLSGGKLVNGHVTKPGEIRGTSIKGGERRRVAAGDIIHIPAGTPHQLLVNRGKPLVYFVVKVSGQ